MTTKSDDNIKNAFAVVRETFVEVAELFKDLEAELKTEGFSPLHNGNEIATEPSKSLNNADRWLYPYISRYYAPDIEDKKRTWLASAGIHYFGHKKLPIAPRFLVGVIKNEKPGSKVFYPWWLPSLYSSEYGRKIIDEKNNATNQISDEEWFKIIPDLPSENWYEEGYVYSNKLVDIKSRSDVNKLALEVKKKFGMVSGM